ncbi:GPI mannosyltransferase 2 [Tolypocladium ophioglossoides CBS 100239]|uniref:GPI mannosyltransferase 2 n=1 Tax=Tolypocladium ophioglossoides (strain CBS 100239) TaxID=1163406 RepID=A0A0L0N3G4_TOLOC|nr:GPI mannosyltransferase 2 [Tolypocladium ophioglossoides CBS 100239]
MVFFSTAHPAQSLTALFAAWKGFLLAIALGAAVGPDYDTSTSLFFERLYGRHAHVPALAARLTRWDALYFMHYARNGYVYEQEWAFGAPLPIVVRGIVALLPSWGRDASAAVEPLVAIAVAHASHLIAVLVLYRLTMVISNDAKLAFVASALHIISPAGLFLSAPYAESPFACLSFIGNLLFALGIRSRRDQLKRSALIVGAGAVFGLATAFRSNGLASGVLFAAVAVDRFLAFARAPSLSRLLTLAAPVTGGICVAAGSVVPQFVAWRRYCGASLDDVEPRPWCSRTLPSIYAFVQDEYWNVGFLRYWTLNQLPLFLLASPMLTILLKSGFDIVRDPLRGLRLLKSGPVEDYRMFVRVLAASQLLVAALAITTYHVQIVSRLSSGYPVWYWWVAGCLIDKKRQDWGLRIAVFMALYAGIQGGLFASFLPPA